MAISSAELEFFRQLVLKKSGIMLEDGKEYLVDARLTPILREAKLDSMGALINRLKASISDPLHAKVVEAMTTNETSFFRDQNPFDALRKLVLPDLMTRRAPSRTLNMWCAASSSGQEPYTIAMILAENFPALAGWQVKFIATDLSRKMIERSRAGRYSQLEINRGLPAPLMVKYFKKQGLEWEIDARLRSMIEFKEMNLLDTWPVMPQLDIVFIRNVLIYFENEAKRQIFRKIRGLLRPDGYMFLGGAETTMNLDESFVRLPLERSGVYQLRPQALAQVA